MRKILLIVLVFMVFQGMANAQSTLPFDEQPYLSSQYPASSTTETNYYDSGILGEWITDAEDQIINIAMNDNKVLVIKAYNLNTYTGKYNWAYTRYAPYVTTVNGTRLLDWNADGSSGYGSGKYVTCKYQLYGKNSLYISRIKHYTAFNGATSSNDYRQYIADNMYNGDLFYTPSHFRRNIAESSSSISTEDVLVGGAIILGGALLLDAIFGSSSNSSPPSYNNNEPARSLSPLGLDKDRQPVYEYNRERDVIYNNDGTIRY